MEGTEAQRQTVGNLYSLQKQALSWRLPGTSVALPRIVVLQSGLFSAALSYDFFCAYRRSEDWKADKRVALWARKRMYELDLVNSISFAALSAPAGLVWGALRSYIFLRRQPEFRSNGYLGIFKQPVARKFLLWNSIRTSLVSVASLFASASVVSAVHAAVPLNENTTWSQYMILSAENWLSSVFVTLAAVSVQPYVVVPVVFGAVYSSSKAMMELTSDVNSELGKMRQQADADKQARKSQVNPVRIGTGFKNVTDK